MVVAAAVARSFFAIFVQVFFATGSLVRSAATSARTASVGSPSIISTAFGQTCCATVATPSTQTIIQTGESARVIQFALKLSF